jgi:hypothetical protein
MRARWCSSRSGDHRAGPWLAGPGPQPAGTGIGGAVAGQQLLDRLGGLPVQVTLAVAAGQATELGCDRGRQAADGAVGMDDHDLRSHRIQRPGSPASAGRGRRQPERQVDQVKRRGNADAEQRDRPVGRHIGSSQGGSGRTRPIPPSVTQVPLVLGRDAAGWCRPVVRMRHR